MANLNIVEASIEELQAVLCKGTLTSVELVARYLQRISIYDCRNLSLNSVPLLNASVFEEAAASDDRRAAGHSIRPLEGITYTVKDSYLVKGMTAACGSPAFEHLVAQEDAFTVSKIRAAGGVLIGRTNMPPMAYGGMQRGIYGRAESPYNSDYLAAAFWSGSSNGSAVATAASFATFGMGEETVSSGRAPASNNGLVAYTPSRGWISIRGNWPLYPTCDIVVPHTRTMRDMLVLLDVITVEDPMLDGDFWREQNFVELEKPSVKEKNAFEQIAQTTSLTGLRIAVPAMYIGGPTPPGATPVTTCAEVIELWQQAQRDLEALGAEIVIVPDFPVITAYENPNLLPKDCPRLPKDWLAVERGPLIAHGWNGFLRHNNDPKFPNIASVDPSSIYPESLRTDSELKVLDRSNAIHFPRLSDYIQQGSLPDVRDLGPALTALEGMRKYLLEDWLKELECDCVVFPAAGDVAKENADVNDENARYARQNGVFYSNGNRALRHLGIPTVSAPMGIMGEKKMPVNLTFVGRAYDDLNLLGWGNAYETKTKKRIPPPLTPAISSDFVTVSGPSGRVRAPRPILTVERCEVVLDSPNDSPLHEVHIAGTVVVANHEITSPELEITVDSINSPAEPIMIEHKSEGLFHFTTIVRTSRPVVRDERTRTFSPVARDKTMVVVLARSTLGGQPSGWLGIV